MPSERGEDAEGGGNGERDAHSSNEDVARKEERVACSLPFEFCDKREPRIKVRVMSGEELDEARLTPRALEGGLKEFEELGLFCGVNCSEGGAQWS